MYIFIDRNGETSLQDAQAFNAFKVVCDAPPETLAASLGPVGALKDGSADSGHIWVSQAWLRHEGAVYGEDWSVKLDKMIAYAASKGWLEEKTGAILAHIE